MLTAPQKTALKNAIDADPALVGLANSPDNAIAIAEIFNLAASPDFWVWRTKISESEITQLPGPDATNWSWNTYKTQSVTEQNTWVRMFNSTYTINPSLANVRAGIADIFQGSAAQNTQRTHVLACCRRKATRAERLFATGTGSTADPGTMVLEGKLLWQDVQEARAS
jgi:hypothetical protein